MKSYPITIAMMSQRVNQLPVRCVTHWKDQARGVEENFGIGGDYYKLDHLVNKALIEIVEGTSRQMDRWNKFKINKDINFNKFWYYLPSAR
jgi:hypothetical protein